jgi:hypothetical protein
LILFVGKRRGGRGDVLTGLELERSRAANVVVTCTRLGTSFWISAVSYRCG